MHGGHILVACHLDRDLSIGFLHLPEEGLDQRGLACPHLTHHCHQLTSLHLKVHSV